MSVADFIQDDDVQQPEPGSSLSAFVEQEPAAAPESEGSDLRPYTAEELASITAGLTMFGLPEDRLEPYQLKVMARTRPAFELLGVGKALAAYGIGAGGALEQLPPWVRLLAGTAVIGAAVVITRRELSYGGVAGDPVGSAGSEVVGDGVE